jgi:uncharacterized protein (DUF302 family)
MMRNIPFAVFTLILSFWASAEESLVTYESQYSAKETADRFASLIKDKGLTLFTRIDHQKNALNVNLELRPTEVIIFGNPKVGTSLIQCAQKSAIDLPQKVLITEDVNKRVWLSFNNPQYIKERHGLKGCDKVIKKISTLLENLSITATTIQNAIHEHGFVNKSALGQLKVWNADSHEWNGIELFWDNFTQNNQAKSWGHSATYPKYEEVKEFDTLVIELKQGNCLMQFFHSRWRRANDVQRWDDTFNEYGGCPYVFD